MGQKLMAVRVRGKKREMKTVKEVEDAILTRLYCFCELWTLFSILKSGSLSGLVQYVKTRHIDELFVLSSYVNKDGLINIC